MDTRVLRDRRHGSLTRRTPAQALVEAAVVFPLGVLLLLGLVQGALYVHARHVVLGAARGGAHVAASEHATIDEALADGRARAESVLAAGLGGYAPTLPGLLPTHDGGGGGVANP